MIPTTEARKLKFSCIVVYSEGEVEKKTLKLNLLIDHG